MCPLPLLFSTSHLPENSSPSRPLYRPPCHHPRLEWIPTIVTLSSNSSSSCTTRILGPTPILTTLVTTTTTTTITTTRHPPHPHPIHPFRQPTCTLCCSERIEFWDYLEPAEVVIIINSIRSPIIGSIITKVDRARTPEVTEPPVTGIPSPRWPPTISTTFPTTSEPLFCKCSSK